MANRSILTDEHIGKFERDGFLHIPREEHGLVAEPSNLSEWASEILSWPREKGKWMPYDEVNQRGEKQLMRTENIVAYFPPVSDLLLGEGVLSILKQLSGKDAFLFKDKINYKLPYANGFVAHIDAPAYYHMGEMPFMEVMVVVDAQTPANGCLEFVPGSHKATPSLVNGGRISDEWEKNHDFVKLDLKPGDVVVFGSRIAHRSGPNLTSKRRAAIFGTYHFEAHRPEMSAEYWAHRRVNFPPDHEREEGESYEAGFKLFGYSSPFTKPEVTNVPTPVTG